MMALTATHPVRVGIVGCGEVTQVIHLPTLNYLSHLFTVTYLCDVSPGSLSFCQSRSFMQPTLTTDPDELITSPIVDLVFIVNSDEYHCTHAVLALKHNKHVFIEKPMALCLRDCDRIVEAERESEGKVMVGYMRRYAAVFEDAVKEVGGMEEVLYARVRDIIAPNPIFVGQSGTFPSKFSDVKISTLEERERAGEEQVKRALTEENGVHTNNATAKMWRTLGS
jgi:predicted dehydrogenase